MAVAACLAAGAPAHAQDSHDSGRTALDLADGLVWLEVNVAGHAEPLHFVLDTGAGVSVIDAETARELGLKPGRALRVQGTEGLARARWMSGFDAKVAGVTLPGRVLSLDLQHVSAGGTRRIDGLLGADFLQDRTVQLDFAGRELRLDKRCASVRSNAVALPLRKQNDAWCVAATVNHSRPGWLRVDTGFDGQLNWCPTASGSAAPPADSTVALEVGSGSETKCKLQLGTLTLPHVATRMLPRPLFARESGLLGLGVLSRYRVTFETHRQRVYLEPAGD